MTDEEELTAEDETGFMEDVGAEATEEDSPTAPLEDGSWAADEEDAAPDDKPADDDESASDAEFEESEPQPETRKAKYKIEQRQKRRDI